jgi:hypothetical protein
MSASPDDWRRRGQEKDLTGARLTWKNYQALSGQWEHEHCDFCWRKFLDPAYSQASQDALANEPDANRPAGYTTLAGRELKNGQYWVCTECFEDFKDEFAWTIVQTDPDAWPYDGPEPDPRPTSADYRPPSSALVTRPE